MATSVNLPSKDDYDAVLGFLNHYAALTGFSRRVGLVLVSQSNEYKLFLQFAIYIAEYSWTGSVNFIFLQQLGNLFVLLTAIVLWLMFQRGTPKHSRLLLFSPVVLILFAPRYGETLNWTMAGLQNLPVLFFSLLSIYLLGRNRPAAFVGGLVSLVLAICSSGNGFFLGLVGLALLWQQRQRSRAVMWIVAILLMAGIYSYRYTAVLVPPVPGLEHPLLSLILFAPAFLGSAAASLPLSFALSAILFGAILLLCRYRWRLLAPDTFYSMAFVLVTALGVAVTRHNIGLRAAITYRYSIYSQLFIAIIYIAAIGLDLARDIPLKLRRTAFLTFLLATVAYCGVMDMRGMRLFHERSQQIVSHYIAWKNDPRHAVLLPEETTRVSGSGIDILEQRAPGTLLRSESLGLYRPPSVESLQRFLR